MPLTGSFVLRVESLTTGTWVFAITVSATKPRSIWIRANNSDPSIKDVRAGPSFTFQILRYLGPHISFRPYHFGLKWTQILRPSGQPTSAKSG